MPPELALVDTNVLVYALVPESPQHARSRAFVERAVDASAGLCVVPQILTEFYAIVTSPKRMTAARSSVEAIAAIRVFLDMPGMSVLTSSQNVVDRLLDLLSVSAVTSQHVHDAHIAAMALSNGIRRIYTFNTHDFKLFPGLELLEP